MPTVSGSYTTCWSKRPGQRIRIIGLPLHITFALFQIVRGYLYISLDLKAVQLHWQIRRDAGLGAADLDLILNGIDSLKVRKQ